MRVDILSKLPKMFLVASKARFLKSDLTIDYSKVYCRNGKYFDRQTYKQVKNEPEEVSIFDANLIGSRLQNTQTHRLMLDLDFECELVPSSTPGRYHLYANKFLHHEDMDKLVNTLVEVGILNEGIKTMQWDANGELALRLPWVKKGDDRSFREQYEDI